MKKKLIACFAACLAAVCIVNAKPLNIQGTWKLISQNGKELPEYYTQLKIITDTHYIWTLIDNQGNIINGAGGTYTLDGSMFNEHITMVLPRMKSFYNHTTSFEISINGDIMIQKGRMRETPVVEVWEKIGQCVGKNRKK